MRLSAGTLSIRSIDDWYKLAPPKGGDRQWKDGRSAKELARAWCAAGEPCAPTVIGQLLSPLLSTEQLAACDGWPEHQIPIDDLPGEPPNIDLALVGDGHHGRTAVCIEAKADEPFDDDVLSLLNAAVVKIARDERTGAVERLQRLAERILPRWETGLPHLADLRYQLLTATAAVLALARAHRAKIAVLVIHEFAIEGCVDPLKQVETPTTWIGSSAESPAVSGPHSLQTSSSSSLRRRSRTGTACRCTSARRRQRTVRFPRPRLPERGP
jgi:hypothetical protein